MNLLILAGAIAACFVIASCIPTTDQVALLETEPIAGPQNDSILTMPTSTNGPLVELKVTRISISGQWVKMDVINRTGVALSSVKGHISFVDNKGEIIYDSLQMRDFQPFSSYKMQGLVGPHSRSSIIVETIVPNGCRDARVTLRQASHADGTVMEFKSLVY
ncbi:MAG TPA: hypothetical protein DIW47_08335 [Bacteroidetes bacterium]|nr:hypothetical protein [Bacteroidota bacterium]